MKSYLEFERDIKTLDEEIEKLKDPFNKEGIGITEVETEKIAKTQREIDEKLKVLYENLNEWQITQVARFEERPRSKYFIENLFTNFINLSGDRRSGEDQALISGFAQFEGRSVLVLGQEKGEDLDSRLKRNFGMMRPQGYRTAVRLMKLADKFNIPIVTFIDTPGAFPSVGSETRGQAEAISSSIECQMSLKVPVIAVVIGEGGSGGAIALASANKVIMLSNAIYSVISPEGCAAILWRDPSKSLESAKAMKLTANNLLKMKIIDEVINEGVAPAHRNKEEVLFSVRATLIKYLDEFKKFNGEEILEQRKEKFLNTGRQKTFQIFPSDVVWVGKSNFFAKVKKFSLNYKKYILILILLMIITTLFLF